MLDVDELVAACHTAIDETDPVAAVREVLSRVVSQPGDVEAALPVSQAELTVIHACDRITIAKVVWAPAMKFPPHDHHLWAAIAQYAGQEQNTFYRRQQGTIVHAGGRLVNATEVAVMADDVIHAVANPSARSFAAAIHVYGGDLTASDRSIWDPDTLDERPDDRTTATRLFEEANRPRRG